MLQQYPSLNHLEISGCELDQVEGLICLTNLKELVLGSELTNADNNKLTDEMVRKLIAMSHLRRLSLGKLCTYSAGNEMISCITLLQLIEGSQIPIHLPFPSDN